MKAYKISNSVDESMLTSTDMSVLPGGLSFQVENDKEYFFAFAAEDRPDLAAELLEKVDANFVRNLGGNEREIFYKGLGRLITVAERMKKL